MILTLSQELMSFLEKKPKPHYIFTFDVSKG